MFVVLGSRVVYEFEFGSCGLGRFRFGYCLFFLLYLRGSCLVVGFSVFGIVVWRVRGRYGSLGTVVVGGF